MTRVLIIEPGYCPYQAAFDSPQAAISEVIEGDSLLLKPFGTSKIGVVCSKKPKPAEIQQTTGRWLHDTRAVSGLWTQ